MKSTITRLATAAFVLIAWFPLAVYAEEPAPTKEQLEAARLAFSEGNTFYKAGKLVEAIEKLEQSYELSRNPLLLYNIAHTYDQLGQKERALFYYRKFLAAAPATAPMRADVQKRVAGFEADGVPETKPDEPTNGTPTLPEKPAVELRHQPVESAVPGTAVDITAVVPSDAGLTVTLHYRGTDDITFTQVPMTWRDHDLVGQIPGEKVQGNYIQYYLDVRDRTGAVVARVGRSTSPSLINIQGGPMRSGLELDDPLTDTRRFENRPREMPTPYATATWISSGIAAATVGTSIIMFTLAKRQSDRLRADSISCGLPPCTPFDEDYDQALESLGRRYNTAYRVTLVMSIASVGAAGYFWYRRLSSPRVNVDDPSTRWAVVPMFGDGFAGAATTGRF